MDISKFRQKFIDEANEFLRKLDIDLLALENDPHDAQKIDQVFRVMHTLKGSSGMFGFDKITEITHELESLYDEVRSGKLQLTQPLIDLTFVVGDHIRNLLFDMECKDEKNILNHHQIKANIDYTIGQLGVKPDVTERFTTTKSTEGVTTYHILFNPDATIITRCINLSITFHDLFLLGKYRVQPPTDENGSAYWSIFLVTSQTYDDIEDALLFVMDYCRISKVADFDIFNEELLDTRDKDIVEAEQKLYDDNKLQATHLKTDLVVPPMASMPQVSVLHADSSTNKILVESAKLDNLMYLVSELVTARSELLASLDESYSAKTLEAAERIDKLSRLFSETTLNIRLVSMEDMLSRFQRLIRDLSKSLGKQVDFVTEGADTELDKNIIDAISEPIMHLVRNCIDHGIEMPEQRIKKGKPEAGTIKISAYSSINYVIIRIEDDGNGIDCERVRLKAIEKGILKSTDTITRKEIFDLIFLPGFSTAQSLTDVSGRGVGMDVVHKKIIDLRGDVEVESIDGQGTAFVLKLQQSIAIIDTLLFKVGDSFFSVPVAEITICSQISSDEIERYQHTGTMPFNNELIPFIDSHKVFKTGGNYSEKIKVIIINNNATNLAILADRIIGEHQALLKPLGKMLQKQDYINCVSQVGDGSLAFMIDTKELFRASNNTIEAT